jgi:hypothetical protein
MGNWNFFPMTYYPLLKTIGLRSVEQPAVYNSGVLTQPNRTEFVFLFV